MALSGKQRRKLRALGHHLQPSVQVGAQGVTAGVVAALEQALLDHELVKVKVPAEREEVASRLAAETGSEVAQVLGRTALLYKRRDEKPEIKLD